MSNNFQHSTLYFFQLKSSKDKQQRILVKQLLMCQKWNPQTLWITWTVNNLICLSFPNFGCQQVLKHIIFLICFS